MHIYYLPNKERGGNLNSEACDIWRVRVAEIKVSLYEVSPADIICQKPLGEPPKRPTVRETRHHTDRSIIIKPTRKLLLSKNSAIFERICNYRRKQKYDSR